MATTPSITTPSSLLSTYFPSAAPTAKKTMDKVHYYLAQFDKELSKSTLIVDLEKRSKVPKTYAVGGLALFYLLLVFFNVFGSLLTNILGFMYPAYASFKAIESPGHKDDVQWLTYWTVFGFLNVLEFFADILLYWIPLYYTFKAGFIIFLILPQLRGAEFLYAKVLKPYLLAHEQSVDGEVEKIKAKVAAMVDEVSKKD